MFRGERKILGTREIRANTDILGKVCRAMSIEKGVDYTSSGTISKKMGNSDVAMAKDDIGKSANADVEAIPSVDTHTDGELAVEGKKLCPLRIWFEGLSSQDRSAAIGFSDDVFLHTFIEVASWSRGQEDESDRSHDGEYQVYVCSTCFWYGAFCFKGNSHARRTDCS